MLGEWEKKGCSKLRSSLSFICVMFSMKNVTSSQTKTRATLVDPNYVGNKAPLEEVTNKQKNHTGHSEDTKDLVASDEGHLRDTMAITKDDTDLGRGQTLLGELEDLGLGGISIELVPRRRGAAVRQRAAGDTVSTEQHTQKKFEAACERKQTRAKSGIKPHLSYR